MGLFDDLVAKVEAKLGEPLHQVLAGQTETNRLLADIQASQVQTNTLLEQVFNVLVDINGKLPPQA